MSSPKASTLDTRTTSQRRNRPTRPRTSSRSLAEYLSPRRCTATWSTATPPGRSVRSTSAAKRSGYSAWSKTLENSKSKVASGKGCAWKSPRATSGGAGAERAGRVGEEALVPEPREEARERVHLPLPVPRRPHPPEPRVQRLVQLVAEVVVVGTVPGPPHPDVRGRRGGGQRHGGGGGGGDGCCCCCCGGCGEA